MHNSASILDLLPRRRAPRRGGFTLVELVIASLIAAMLLGTIATSLGALAGAKTTSRLRANAYSRADAALESIRRDVISVLRRDDLFYTQLLLIDDFEQTLTGAMDRDELLLFNLRLREARASDYAGEGAEYETQYRIEEDDEGSVLWQRRDPVPDTNPYGGGVLTPLVTGVIGINFEAHDGEDWLDYWDSDEDGIPHAIRITVTATGEDNPSELLDSPLASLRTVVPIDRVVPPADLFEPQEEEEEEVVDDEISQMQDQIDQAAEGQGGMSGGESGRPGTGGPSGPTQGDGDSGGGSGGGGSGGGGSGGGGSGGGGSGGGGSGGGDGSGGGGSTPGDTENNKGSSGGGPIEPVSEKE